MSSDRKGNQCNEVQYPSLGRLASFLRNKTGRKGGEQMIKDVRVPLTEDQRAKIKESPGAAGSERVSKDGEGPGQTTSMASLETSSADLSGQDTAMSAQEALRGG